MKIVDVLDELKALATQKSNPGHLVLALLQGSPLEMVFTKMTLVILTHILRFCPSYHSYYFGLFFLKDLEPCFCCLKFYFERKSFVTKNWIKKYLFDLEMLKGMINFKELTPLDSRTCIEYHHIYISFAILLAN